MSFLTSSFLTSKHRKIIYLLIVLCISIYTPKIVHAAEAGRFVEHVYHDNAGDHKYVVFLPNEYTPQKKFPVILFLHGAGERGTDGKRQLTVGLGDALKQRKSSFPFIVVFPQCEKRNNRILTAWSAGTPDGQRALSILADVEQQYSVDKTREILTGWSMGGYGAWSLAEAQPKRFRALVVLSSGSFIKKPAKLKQLPIWVFHGAHDTIVRPQQSQKIINALKQAGGKPRYTVYANGQHDINRAVYNNQKLIEWMLAPQADGLENLAAALPPSQNKLNTINDSEPFVPAMEISQAASLRLGNHTLEAASYAIPEMMDVNSLQGNIGNISDTTVASGRTFSINFTGITYQANVQRVYLKALADGNFRIQMAVSNAHMMISRTYVRGRHRSAVAGPIDIQIGIREPVWLSVDVKPTVVNRKIKLQPMSTWFEIQRGNWYVSAPRGVSTRGLFMTSERVSASLVRGLYGSKSRIESEVMGAVPSIVAELESRLDFRKLGTLSSSFWPLPVYHPRLRVWPESVSVNAEGITLGLGVTVAAFDYLHAPKAVQQITLPKISASTFSHQKGLSIGVQPQVLHSITALLVDSHVAHINVLDLPEKTFGDFANPQLLANLIPDLKKQGNDIEISAELLLSKPLDLAMPPKAEKKEDTAQLALSAPEVTIALSIHKKGEAEWKPYANIQFRLKQQAAVQLLKPSFTKRAVRMNWLGNPSIETRFRFAKGSKGQPKNVNTKELQQLFIAGWNHWTKNSSADNTLVADFAFGNVSQRLKSIGWEESLLSLSLGNPLLRISNRSKEPFSYATKSPLSDWGSPYTLKPGEHHDFEVPYAMMYRRQTPTGIELYQLPAGSHSEFRVPSPGGSPALFKASEPGE